MSDLVVARGRGNTGAIYAWTTAPALDGTQVVSVLRGRGRPQRLSAPAALVNEGVAAPITAAVADDDTKIVAWAERSADGEGSILVAVAPPGESFGPARTLASGRVGDPLASAAGDRVLLTWRSASGRSLVALP